MSAAFDTLFTRHALASYAKQLRLSDVIGDSGAWEVDLPAGRLSFGALGEFSIGLLGSYGAKAGTWRWAWANEAMKELPARVLATAAKMRELGVSKSITELAEGDVEANEDQCHRFAMVAVGESGAGAYFRGPYDGGAAFFEITEPLKKSPDEHRLMRIQRVIAEGLSSFELQQRLALEVYFASEKLRVEETGASEIRVKAEDGDLRIRFDDDGRVTEMKSLLKAGKPKGGFFNRLFGRD